MLTRSILKKIQRMKKLKQFTKRNGLPDTLFWHLYFLVNTTYTVLICHAWIKNVTRIYFQARAKIRNMITLKKTINWATDKNQFTSSRHFSYRGPQHWKSSKRFQWRCLAIRTIKTLSFGTQTAWSKNSEVANSQLQNNSI